jgi:hypothetical protein
MDIRYPLRKLTAEGWVETLATNGDKRVKVIKSKEKMKAQFTPLGHHLDAVIKTTI